ncbi:MAG TPA: hypothetical protein VMI11_15585 [Actinomycetes bacterium]|nr:hypothetical protein [Actinomycetes bacterium]
MGIRRLSVLILTAVAVGGCAQTSAGSAATFNDSRPVASRSDAAFSVTTLSKPETFDQGFTRFDPVPKSFSPKVTAAEAFEAVRREVEADKFHKGEVFLALWTEYGGASDRWHRPVWVVHVADVQVAISGSGTGNESSLIRQGDAYAYVDAVSGKPILAEVTSEAADSPARSWSPLPSPSPK